MPIIGVGSWGLKEKPAEVIAEALRMGYRMVDTSGDYGTQKYVGEGVRKSGVPREEEFVVTKVEEDEDAHESAHRQIQELGLDPADLIVIHRPPEAGAGVGLWQGLIDAREEGLTRDIGVSNYTQEQIQELIDETGVVPAVNQIEWSPFGYSDEMLNFLNKHGIILQAYSSLTHAKRLDDARLKAIAAKYGKTPAQILLRWDIERGVVPIFKANRIEHLRENMGIFDFELEPMDVEKLNALNEHFSALGGKISYN
ncbi:aldo/keto reductase [Candidatus Parcubacteria bacterium]|nr:aldo/keto reductase [Candidatus Parcubacteria bacterium]